MLKKLYDLILPWPEQSFHGRMSLLWFFTQGWARLNRGRLSIAAAMLFSAFFAPDLFGSLALLGGAAVLAVATLGGGGSVTGTVTTGDLTTAAITVLTMPATADYTYEVDIQCFPNRADVNTYLIWGGEGFQPGDGRVAGNSFSDAHDASGAAAISAWSLGRMLLKVGPSTPVTVMYQNNVAATPTYRIAYNYVGYKIT